MPLNNLNQPSSVVRSATLSGYIELVESLGRDPRAFLNAVGLTAQLLRDPDAPISRDAARELLEITARATRTEDFALRLAAKRKLSNLGPICLVLKEEPTARHGLETLRRYLKLINPSLILNIDESEHLLLIREDLLPSPGLSMRQSVELAVGTMYRILSELAGPSWRPEKVYFSHRAPIDLSAYQHFFGQRPEFNQEFDGLVCDAAELSKPRLAVDPIAGQYARRYVELATDPLAQSARDLCYQSILALLPNGACSAQTTARLLQMDRRSFHRRLQAEESSYIQVLQQVRVNLAKRHLGESDLALTEIAELLGFSRLSSFSHWFQQAFSCSASDWRERQSIANDIRHC